MGRAEQVEALRRLVQRRGKSFVIGDGTFRMRRGQLVRIPDEWVGHVTRPQTIRKRKNRWDDGPAYGRMDYERREGLAKLLGEEVRLRTHARRMPPSPTHEMNRVEIREQLGDLDG